MDPYDRLQAGDELSESLMPPLSTGEMLAIRREELGYSLAQAADALRIRYVYLQAIEDGRYHDLPGMAYAIGFVRSYAEFLGLEPEEAVRRFKQEIHGLERAPSLSFPVPKPEGKVPGGALILISVLLIALGYGAWYFLTTSGNQITEVLPSAEPVAEESDQAAASAAGDDQQAAGASSSESEDSAQQASAGASARQGSSEQSAEPQAPIVGPSRNVLETGQADIGAGAEIEIPSTAATESASADAATPAATATTEAVQAADQATTEAETPQATVETATQTAVVEPPAAPQLPAGVAAGGRIFGADNADARVVLAATSDSWVQVRDAEGELLLTQVLRTGDSFLVPNQPGVTMRTGNAGGLSITVDGRQIATLGALGDVIDGVLLEPDRLLNGTAVSPR